MPGVKNKICLTYDESHRIENGILEKLCNRCWEWYSCTNENFYANSKSPDGLFPNCKSCNRNSSYDIYLTNKEKSNKSNREWYYKNKEYKDDKSRNYCREHKEQVSETQRIWQQNNPDRCREYNDDRQHKNHKVNTKEWESCKKYFNHRCAYCGLAIEDHWIKFKGKMQLGDFHKEHVNHCGANDLSNCVPSCKSCNSSKHESTLDDWYPKQEFYSKNRHDIIIKWITDDYKKFITQLT